MRGRLCRRAPTPAKPKAGCQRDGGARRTQDQQLTYEAVGKGRWPGRQRSHGDTGYVEFVLELLGGEQRLLDALAPTLANRSGVQRNSPCPCGSGMKYKRCHLRAVEEISRKV